MISSEVEDNNSGARAGGANTSVPQSCDGLLQQFERLSTATR